MADPEVDHGFVYDDQGLVDILQSPFFNPNPEVDNTVKNILIASSSLWCRPLKASTIRTVANHRSSSRILPSR
ncbi:hypothetical protein M5K25_016707 [Dendrobium thyrsiflorum]|uniref:Uncharacterized protein n=1 Tax=Dendrobium thyrsiflorum TaxID=117978 RepID=A0ABD0UKU2_DENTH